MIMWSGHVICSKRLATPDADGTGDPICTVSVARAEGTSMAHEMTRISRPYSGTLILLPRVETGDINTSWDRLFHPLLA